jgi:hypothetical protein
MVKNARKERRKKQLGLTLELESPKANDRIKRALQE